MKARRSWLSTRRLRQTAMVAIGVLVASSATFMMTTPASAASSCETYSNGQCFLPPEDGTSIVMSQIYDCNQYVFGMLFGDKGYDTPVHIALSGVSANGEVQRNVPISISMLFGHDCRSWSDAYSFDASMTSSTGKVYSVNLQGTNHRYYQDNTDVESYCFVHDCGMTTFIGNISIPTDAPAGKYTFTLHGVANEPVIEKRGTSKYWSWGSVLSIAALPGDPAGFPDLTLNSTNNSGNGPQICFTQQLTSALVSSSQVTGIHWVIRNGNGGTPLDDFIYPIPPDIDKGGPVGDSMQNGNAFASVQNSGAVAVGYVFRSTLKGTNYSCQMSFVGAKGEGSATTTSFQSEIATENFKVIQAPAKLGPVKAIKCVSIHKPNITRIVRGTSPKCPAGYKIKK